MQSLNVKPDETSYGYLIKTLCQELKVDDAWKVAEEMKKQNLSYSPAFSAIATSCALIGDVEGAKKAIQEAKEAIQNDLKNLNAKMDEKMRASVPLFLKLRNEEVERECQRVEEYLAKIEGQGNFQIW